MAKPRVRTVLSQSQNNLTQSMSHVGFDDFAVADSALPSWVRGSGLVSQTQRKPDVLRSLENSTANETVKLKASSNPSQLLSVADAAWRLSLSEKTVRRMITAGNLAVIRIGRSIRIHPEVIEKIMCQNE